MTIPDPPWGDRPIERDTVRYRPDAQPDEIASARSFFAALHSGREIRLMMSTGKDGTKYLYAWYDNGAWILDAFDAGVIWHGSDFEDAPV